MLSSILVAFLSASPQQASSFSLADHFRAGEETLWVIEVGGKRIGQHWSRYLGRDALAGAPAHHFQGRLRMTVAQLGNAELLSDADLWTDDGGRPVRFAMHGLLGDGYSRVDIDFADGQANARIAQGTSSNDMQVPADPTALLLGNNLVSHLEIVLAHMEPGKDASFKMFSGNTLIPFDYDLKARGTFEHEENGVKKTGYIYDDSLAERLRVVDGRLISLEVESERIVIRRSDEKLIPFTITPPQVRQASSAFVTEEVKIQHGDAVIAGSITKPKNAKGKLSAVFFISGSGAQDRHGMASGIDVGTHEILDRLTTDGMLVLRVDDRGAGASSLPPANMSYLDLVGDARVCVEYLRKRVDVDPARIALIGHSEGGETAPILATDPALSIAAIVLMAAPGRSLIEILRDQNRMALEESGLTGKELDAKLDEVMLLLKRVCGDGPIDAEELPADQRSILQNRAWLQTHAAQDPIATIQKVRCPVLVLHGAKDFQVSVDRDARALDAALKSSAHPDHELVVFEKLDHLFKVTPGEKSRISDYVKARPVAPEFLDKVSSWLKKRLAVESK